MFLELVQVCPETWNVTSVLCFGLVSVPGTVTRLAGMLIRGIYNICNLEASQVSIWYAMHLHCYGERGATLEEASSRAGQPMCRTNGICPLQGMTTRQAMGHLPILPLKMHGVHIWATCPCCESLLCYRLEGTEEPSHLNKDGLLIPQIPSAPSSLSITTRVQSPSASLCTATEQDVPGLTSPK